MKTTYKEINGMFFNEKTPQQVCEILAQLNQNKKRVKLIIGNTETGKSWNEEYDTTGTIGKSTGNIKIPLLIATKRSHGGGAVMDDNILIIREMQTGRILYQAPNFKPSTFEIKPITNKELNDKGYFFSLFINGEVHANCKTEKECKRVESKIK